MKILVTGGAGFIASHIVDSLIKLQYEVVVIDNLSTGNIKNINKSCTFYKLDLMDPALENIFDSFKPEVVIHHAAQVSVLNSLNQPLLDSSVNINGTIRILDLMKRFKSKKIIYASSAAVYGIPNQLPITENHLIRPISFYGISKYVPEQYIAIYSELYGLDYTILRYSNAYGPRQVSYGEGGVVSIFIDKLINNEYPVIFGDGEQIRDFIFVKDIVSANLSAINNGSRDVYNISSGTETTINKLLSNICYTLGVEYSPQYASSRKGDILHSCLSNEKAIKDLGWNPEFSLDHGILETCEYYQKCEVYL
ncbi:UDP-glucose 4-epimerase [Paenibacillus sp. CECT 9249]|uniref:NAD-dependent epimerase/dehydratase family protein n=1 Tax=Paenibacillus sp. CECT 9249 TaxID=2845385 RepID=UPI001E54EA0E|nr:NAD-dependent epimerase/dehydratase family protein [Paenibacillus sp. CECT 9249]CAH0122355.1 UDP-glucose 4-epimerase [Paenibacillus sp. CECT 9249]